MSVHIYVCVHPIYIYTITLRPDMELKSHPPFAVHSRAPGLKGETGPGSAGKDGGRMLGSLGRGEGRTAGAGPPPRRDTGCGEPPGSRRPPPPTVDGSRRRGMGEPGGGGTGGTARRGAAPALHRLILFS